MDIRRVAQTNIGLYRQMHDLGYSLDALNLARKTYGLACSLFTSRFRATEKPFLCHLVGTASIVAQLVASPDLVALALLHAAYESGNFGFGATGPTRRNRERVRNVVGDAIEERIFLYWKTPWNRSEIVGWLARAEHLSEEDTELLTVRLANALEDHLDLAMCYCAESRRQSEGSLEELSRIARSLRLDGLGQAFEALSNDMREAGWTRALATGRRSSYRLDPKDTFNVAGAVSWLRR